MEAKIWYVRPSEVKIRELGVKKVENINLDKVQIKKIIT